MTTYSQQIRRPLGHITRPLSEEELPPDVRAVVEETPPPEKEKKAGGVPDNIHLIDEQPLRLELTDWLYASDFHVPLHNIEYVKRLIRVGKKSKVSDLIIGGDFFDFDSLSDYPKTTRQAMYKATKNTAGDLFYELTKHFRIYILPGNHCERKAKRLGEVLDLADDIWAGMRGRKPKHEFVVTNYDYIYVGEEETGWVVGHPRYFSTVPARMGAMVADLKRRNVIGAHNHILGLMRSPSGRFISIDPGHMTTPNITPYYLKSNGLSKFPAWSAGFVLVRDNIPTLMSDGLVEWSDWGC